MLKKIFLLFIFAVFVTLSSVQAEEVAKIRSGTFLKVMNLNEISTLMSDAEDEVVFINTQDMYIYETNVIPVNTRVYGEIEEILEPVQGRNGALKISIYKMITPDKKVYRVKGHIYTQNGNYIGWEYTEPTYYRKVVHYHHRMQPMLQVVPLNVLEMGKHTVINPGAELFVILEEDIILK